MKRIFCPTDLSLNSRAAIRYADLIADKFNGHLILFHSFFIPPPLPEEYKVKSPEEVFHYGQMLLKDSCQKFAEELLTKDVSHECLIKKGFVLDEIVKHIGENPTDMVIMDTEGAHGFIDLFPGTISSNVIKNVQCPVLVIPANSNLKPFKKIVYSTDLKGDDKKNIEFAINFAQKFDAHIQFINIQKGLNEKDKNKAIQMMKDSLQQFSYPNIDIEVLEGKNIIRTMFEYINEQNADLLVMSTKRRNAFERFFSRSLTGKVTSKAMIPVLAMHK